MNRKKVKLPFFMGGMNKLYYQNDINKWLLKHSVDEFIISDKLMVIVQCIVTRLHCRRTEKDVFIPFGGRGSEGRDISKLIPFIGIQTICLNVQ